MTDKKKKICLYKGEHSHTQLTTVYRKCEASHSIYIQFHGKKLTNRGNFTYLETTLQMLPLGDRDCSSHPESGCTATRCQSV
jgi:hypothetical protein